MHYTLTHTSAYFKVIILGDSETGKTSLLIRFDQDKYTEGGLSATVGVGYAVST